MRGVPVRKGRDEITDVDLWVYTRSSVHSRNIAIVDIKNKKRSKGYERVIWIKGLQALLSANEAIIASPSGREDLKPFASRIGVRVFALSVYQAILARYSAPINRLSSEQLNEIWRAQKLDGYPDLCARMQGNIQEIGLGIAFPTLNQWIDEAAQLLTLSVDHERTPGPFFRSALLCSALAAIGADYLGRELSFSDQDARREAFRSGLLFGRSEKDAGRSYLNFAESAVTDFIDKSGGSAAMLRMGFNRAVEELPINQFIEFFARPTAGRELMEAALRLEDAAFAIDPPVPAELSTEAKTILGLVADYADLDRRRVIGSVSAQPSASSSGATQSAKQSARPGDAPDRLI